MSFTKQANKIFNEAIVEYHVTDDINTKISNPYSEGSIENILFLKKNH